MGDEEILISGIEYKVRKLIEKQKKLSIRNEELENQNRGLKEQIKEQQYRINNLEDKLRTLKTAKILDSDKGSVEAKKKINELVREIDRCIGILNK